MLLSNEGELAKILADLHHELSERQITVGTAESCTGGLLGGLLTHLGGSSAYFKGGIIAYANEVKESLLGVSSEIIHRHGAVSRETALAMVQGATRKLRVDLAVAVTGIAGPGGGTSEKPVGTVWYAWQYGKELNACLLQLKGNRQDIRSQAALAILRHIYDLIAPQG